MPLIVTLRTPDDTLSSLKCYIGYAIHCARIHWWFAAVMLGNQLQRDIICHFVRSIWMTSLSARKHSALMALPVWLRSMAAFYGTTTAFWRKCVDIKSQTRNQPSQKGVRFETNMILSNHLLSCIHTSMRASPHWLTHAKSRTHNLYMSLVHTKSITTNEQTLATEAMVRTSVG